MNNDISIIARAKRKLLYYTSCKKKKSNKTLLSERDKIKLSMMGITISSLKRQYPNGVRPFRLIAEVSSMFFEDARGGPFFELQSLHTHLFNRWQIFRCFRLGIWYIPFNGEA